jgi:hypothetical protein
MGGEAMGYFAMTRNEAWRNLARLELADAAGPEFIDEVDEARAMLSGFGVSDFLEQMTTESRIPRLSTLVLRKPLTNKYGYTKILPLDKLFGSTVTSLDLDFGFKNALWEKDPPTAPFPHMKKLKLDGLLFTQIRGSAILGLLHAPTDIRLSIREEPIFFVNDLNQLEEVFNRTISVEVQAMVTAARGPTGKEPTVLDVCVPIMEPDRADQSARMWTEAISEVFSRNSTLQIRDGSPGFPEYWGKAPLSMRIRLDFASEAMSNPVWWGPGLQFRPLEAAEKKKRIGRSLEFTAAVE